MLANRPWSEWIADYGKSHQHPVNRFFHTIGIPMIVVSLIVLLISVFAEGWWKWGIALFVLGWVFQFIGHAFEKKPPEFFKDWRFLLVGLRWWFYKITGRA